LQGSQGQMNVMRLKKYLMLDRGWTTGLLWSTVITWKCW